jgi:6-phosphogluconolactonase
MNSTTIVELIEHESSADAASLVAEEAAAWLGICCVDGSATVALPGGRSPAAMLRILAAHPIRWDRITVTTTDERKVPLDHSLSNMGNVRRAFHGQFGQRATFVPLQDRYAHCSVRLPFDLLVLGMGADGHIASLFPGMPHGASTDLPIIEVTPDPIPIEAPVARRTWSLPALAASRRTLLFCAGADKRAAIDASLQSTDSPLGAFLARAHGPVTIHWTERT